MMKSRLLASAATISSLGAIVLVGTMLIRSPGVRAEDIGTCRSSGPARISITFTRVALVPARLPTACPFLSMGMYCR